MRGRTAHIGLRANDFVDSTDRPMNNVKEPESWVKGPKQGLVIRRSSAGGRALLPRFTMSIFRGSQCSPTALLEHQSRSLTRLAATIDGRHMDESPGQQQRSHEYDDVKSGPYLLFSKPTHRVLIDGRTGILLSAGALKSPMQSAPMGATRSPATCAAHWHRADPTRDSTP